MRRLLFVAGEGEGHRQRADTPAVHVDGEDELGHPVPVGALAGGKPACGERRGGLKQRMQQLHVGLHHGNQEAGDKDEPRLQHHNSGCPLHQRRRNGFVVELDVLSAFYRGDDGFDDDEQRGGLDTAARGAGGAANEYCHQNQDDGGYFHRIDIQYVKSRGSAGRNLKYGGE